jgi:rhodanese-related sulfurtransferase
MSSERTTIDKLLGQARLQIRRLTPQEAASAQATGAVIVDTRDSADRAADGIIPDSILVTRNTLEWRADPSAELPDPRLSNYKTDLIIVCNDGYSSSLAADSLRRLGHASAGDIVGGYRAWKAAKLPTTAPPGC